MKLTIETELEEETGRWIAEVMELPGVMKYGASRSEAILRAKVLALEVIADQLEHGERLVDLELIEFAVPTVAGATGERDADGG